MGCNRVLLWRRYRTKVLELERIHCELSQVRKITNDITVKNNSKIIILLTLLILAVYPTVKKLSENQKFQLILAHYQSEEQGFIDRVKQHFRYVPKDRLNLEIKEVFHTDKLQLFRIDNMFRGIPSYGYYVYESGDISELKHWNVLLAKIRDLNLTEEQIIQLGYYELMVDLDQFNRIFNELSNEEKMRRYCELFCTSASDETFELITSKNQISEILNGWPITNGFPMVDEHKLVNFDFIDSLESNQLALWTFDMGVKVFSFTFDEANRLTDCKIEFKGHLGNEVVHL